MSADPDKSRRLFLQSSGALTSLSLLRIGAPALMAITQAACSAKQEAAAFITLGAAEAADFAAIAARIMPTTDTPGASEAGVIYFFDRALGAEMQSSLENLRTGLAALNANTRRFAEDDEDTQDQRLTEIEDSRVNTVATRTKSPGISSASRVITVPGSTRSAITTRNTPRSTPMTNNVTFDQRKPVDFAIIGSGSAGGIIAKELSTAGFNVVLFEQGPYRKASDFTHDEYSTLIQSELLGGGSDVNGHTFRHDESEVAKRPAMPSKERSLLGPISGTNFADWPITYEELEPYYTKVDWEIGISGAPGPFDAPRSKPFPMPPLPIKSCGVLFEKGAKALGLHPQHQPHAILSEPFNGRAGCMKCGYCMYYGCEAGAKSSTLASMIPLAEASGHCEIRAESAVFRIETDSKGRASEVLYYDRDGKEQAQKVKAVVVSANGAESARLMLLSASERHPDGLANSSGFVGRNLMFNAHSSANAVFEHPLNEFKGVQASRVLHDFYDSDEKRGFYGGGGIDARALWSATPIFHAWLGMPPDVPRWGKSFKDEIAHNFTRQMTLASSTTSLAMDRNNITLDPSSTDQWGRPAIRATYRDHDDDLSTAKFLQDVAMEILDAADAKKAWADPIHPTNGGEHLLGTCRMGDDPASSVVDRYHRSHDVSNLFICDGSSMVTSGRGQPTMTIMALAFRAAEHIKAAANAGNI
jgi:choline dehydrogenase-like flavoprotein